MGSHMATQVMTAIVAGDFLGCFIPMLPCYLELMEQ